jgi:glutamate racemase
MDSRPIGVFDSGLGGLTVVKELLKELPDENIVYFGDTARIPYGTRSREIVTKYSAQCIRFLLSKGIKMVVIACNTVSAGSLDALTALFDLPILGVIGPGARAAVEATQSGRIGVAGTSGTIRSQAYPKAIHELSPDAAVIDEACTLFVPIVEEGWSDTEVARLTAERYLDNMKKQAVDTVVLGCTHYPLLENTISKIMGPDVRLINPAVNAARQTREILMQGDMLREPGTEPSVSFYVSDFGQSFQKIGSHFLNREIAAECVDIERY